MTRRAAPNYRLMKTTLTILSLLVVSIGFGQVKLQPIQTKPTVVADTMANETIEHCDAMIAAIDYKVDFVNNDPAKKEKALKDGWFDQMAHHKACFIARREELIRRGQTK